VSARRILGLIPARGGSKGLPGKNVRQLAGRPLIAWTIGAARESGVLDTVVVSTDDEEISAAARAEGAEVLARPDSLASDDSPMMDAVRHAIESLAASGRTFTHLMLLQPTSPLRTADDVRSAVDRLDQSPGRAVVSVCPAEHSPLLANTLPDDGSMAAFLRPEVATSNRQAMPQYYRLNGAVYLAEIDALLASGSFVSEDTYALVMPIERSVDIDSELDFQIAECLLARERA
jgi:CMP-N-acetylneuraminic acid synthetase